MGNGASMTDLILASGRIAREHVPVTDREWNVFFDAPSTLEGICSTIHPSDIRQMRYRQPRNLGALVRKCIDEMNQAAIKMTPKEYPRAMAACRILTRVIPVLLEVDGEDDDFAQRLLWAGETPMGWLRDEEAVRVGLDPRGVEPYGPSDADEGDGIGAEEMEARARELELAREERSAKRDDAAKEGDSGEGGGGEAGKGDDEAAAAAAAAGGMDEGGMAKADATTDARAAGVGGGDDDDDNDDGSGEAGTAGDEDVGGPEPDLEVPGVGVVANPSKEVAAVLRRVSRGEVPPGFRRAQAVADLSQPPPKLRWARVNWDGEEVEGDAEGDRVSPGRVLCHALMRLLFSPGLTIDAQSFAFYKNKRRVLRERAAAAAESASAEAAASATAPGGDSSTSTTSSSLNDCNAVWPTLLWAAGVGFDKVTTSVTSAMVESRSELLRLLVSLLSKPLFVDPNADTPVRDPLADTLTAPDCPFGPTLTLSLLNTVLAYDPVGLNGYIPYASTIMPNGMDQLTDTCLHALLLLIHHSPNGRPRASVVPPPASLHHAPLAAPADPFGLDGTASTPKEEGPGAPGATAEDPDGDGAMQRAASHSRDAGSFGMSPDGETLTADVVGVHRAMLASIRHPRDLSLVATRLSGLLNTVWQSDAAYFPGSTSNPVLCQQELVALLYYLLCDNPVFVSHLVREGDTGALVVPLCYFLWVGRLSAARSQFLHLCTFVLFLLSGYRDFAVSLNAPVKVSPSASIPITPGVSTHADLVVLTLHRLVVNATRRLRPLYGHFLATLSNVSPYIKRLSLDSSVKIGALLDILASPRFLFARPDNFALLAHLITALGNMMQYQFVGNEETMYALVRAESRIEWLAALSTETATEGHKEAVKRAQGARATENERQGAPARDAGAEGSDSQARGGEDKDAGQQDDASSSASSSSSSSASSSSAEAAAGTAPPSSSSSSSSSASSGDGGQQDTTAAAPPPVAPSASPDASNGDVADGDDTDDDDDDDRGDGDRAGGEPTDIVWADWKPTKAWLDEQLASMPLLKTVLTGTRYLSAMLRRECVRLTEEGGVPDDETLIGVLRNTTLVGVLPRPHALYARRSDPSQATWRWLSAFVWGVIFLRGISQPLFDTKGIKLFQLQVV